MVVTGLDVVVIIMGVVVVIVVPVVLIVVVPVVEKDIYGYSNYFLRQIQIISVSHQMNNYW